MWHTVINHIGPRLSVLRLYLQKQWTPEYVVILKLFKLFNCSKPDKNKAGRIFTTIFIKVSQPFFKKIIKYEHNNSTWHSSTRIKKGTTWWECEWRVKMCYLKSYFKIKWFIWCIFQRSLMGEFTHIIWVRLLFQNVLFCASSQKSHQTDITLSCMFFKKENKTVFSV